VKCQGGGLWSYTAPSPSLVHKQAQPQLQVKQGMGQGTLVVSMHQVQVPGAALGTPWLPTRPRPPVQHTRGRGGRQWRQAPCTWWVGGWGEGGRPGAAASLLPIHFTRVPTHCTPAAMLHHLAHACAGSGDQHSVLLSTLLIRVFACTNHPQVYGIPGFSRLVSDRELLIRAVRILRPGGLVGRGPSSPG
jgi:hypothetical protein